MSIRHRVHSSDVAGPLALELGAVDIWLVGAEPHSTTELLYLRDLLSCDEQRRLEQFLVEAPRQQYLIARATLRMTLSKYSNVAPRAWRFATNRYGRPRIDAPLLTDQLYFNVSHCDGLIAIAVARTADIGIDVENVARRLDTDLLAPAVFTETECAALAAAPNEDRRKLFFALWTLKEAYIKARGMGLSIDLAGFEFKIAEPHPLVRFNFRCPDVSEKWRFWHYFLDSKFSLALAAPQSTREVRFRRTHGAVC